MKTNPSPQQSPVTALAQLLAEHPDLTPIRWEISAAGHLSGLAMCLAFDPRPAMAGYAAVLGGTPDAVWSPETGGFSTWLSTTWRDVAFSITLGCRAELAPCAEMVAA